MEARPVRPGRNLDDQRACRGILARVVQGQALAHIRRSPSHHRVVGGVIIGTASEYRRADYSLAQELVIACHCMFDDIRQHALTLRAAAERFTREDCLQSRRGFSWRDIVLTECGRAGGH